MSKVFAIGEIVYVEQFLISIRNKHHNNFR